MKEILLTSYRRDSHAQLDSPAIQAALDACSSAGGGTVTLDPGTYRCGTLFLRDNVTLHLRRGAVIMGSAHLKDYPMPATPFVDAVGHTRGRALLVADHVSGFALRGEGVIDGNGGAFALNDPEHLQRPFLIRLVDAKRFEIRGLVIRNSAAWTVHLLNCEDALIEHVRIDSRINENNDGIDIDSSRRVVVRHCEILTDDDAICLKATRAEPCEDVDVHDCVLSTECSALKLGTESYGDIRRVKLHDCHVLYAATGAIKILTSDGGVYEDIEIRNVTIDKGTGPIFFRLGSRGRTYAPGCERKGPGIIRNVVISGVRANVFVPPKDTIVPFTGEPMPPAAFSGMLFTGVPGHPIEDITLEDCELTFIGGYQGDPAAIRTPEQPEMYPEHFYFGALPGSAAFFRHARNITLRNVQLKVTAPDSRPLLASEDVEGLHDDLPR